MGLVMLGVINQYLDKNYNYMANRLNMVSAHSILQYLNNCCIKLSVLAILFGYGSLQNTTADFNSTLEMSTIVPLEESTFTSTNESTPTLNPVESSSLFEPLVNPEPAYLNNSAESEVEECKVFSNVCGKAFVDVRIVGGSQARPYSYPWQAIIRYYKKYMCSGTVINGFYILTAAHCIFMMQDLQELIEAKYGSRVQSTNGSVYIKQISVVLGAYNTEELSETTEYNVEQYLIHPNHSVDEVHDTNDIALMKLRQRILYTGQIQPICLPNQGEVFDGHHGVVIGWGRIKFNGSHSKYLKQANVKILPDSACINSPIGSHFAESPNSMICAYENETDACKGDSGGPLLYKNDLGFYIQVGIVSWGIECALVGYPGVYTEVSSYIDWIKNSIAELCY